MGINPLLKVTGQCPKCTRRVTREAPRGRVTWRGDCPNSACDGTIIARKEQAEAPPPSETPSEAPPETSTNTEPPKPKKGVPRVAYGNQSPDGTSETGGGGGAAPVRKRRGQPAGDQPAGQPPAGEQPPPAAAEVPGGTGPASPGRKPRQRRWGWEHPYSNLGF